MDYSDCASERRDVYIAVAENRRTFRLHNPAKRLVIEVKVDGCLMPNSMERCDYLFIVPTLLRGNDAGAAPAARDAERPWRRSHGDRGNDTVDSSDKPQVFYVELKGKDVLKAISQIRSTMDYTRQCHQAYGKTCCVVASRVAPAMMPGIQAEMAKLRKNYQAKLRVATQELQVDIP